jgi:hypothetical protein
VIRRSRNLRSFAAPLTAALLAIVLVTAAGGRSVAAATPPAKWTGSVCTSLAAWRDTLHTAASTAGETTTGAPLASKQALSKLLATSNAATVKLLATLKKAGVPADTGGKKTASTIRQGFAQAQRSIAEAKKSVAKASAKDKAKLLASARSAQDGVEAGLESVQTALGVARYLDSPALLDAFKAEVACADAITPDATAPTITLDPSEGPPRTEVTIVPDADAAAVSTCFGSSAFRSELLGDTGAIVGTGEETLEVPSDATGVVTARLVCYFPESTGRRVIRGLCAPFTVTGAAPVASTGSGCPSAPRVVVGQVIIEGEGQLSAGFNQVLAPFAA